MSSVLVLKHISGSKAGHVEEFGGASILIGRGAHNDVALDPFLDPTVSASHAEIRLESDRFMIYDMGSLNGTFVNGCHVRRAEIRPGDEIGLGRKGPRLAFAAGDEEPPRYTPSRGPRLALNRTTEEPVQSPAARPKSVFAHPLSQRILLGIVAVLVVVLAALVTRLILR